MRFVLTNEGKIYDLESKKVSSWEYIDEKTAINVYGCEEAFYFIYYYDEEEGPYLECDDKGGHSMDSFNESEILKQGDMLEDICDCLMYVDKKEDFLITEVVKENMVYYPSETCYGCIKVKLPSGAIRLEPIAKMNRYGGLELL